MQSVKRRWALHITPSDHGIVALHVGSRASIGRYGLWRSFLPDKQTPRASKHQLMSSYIQGVAWSVGLALRLGLWLRRRQVVSK